jgi:6-pyruvoyltetrahydropterin/6-carboxytetrahydropterin synthase
MKISVCRKEQFNAAHRLYNPDWEEERNEKVFGKCNNPNFHGHNYELIVKIIGDPDPDTGYVYDLKELSDLINLKIINKLDHRNLNLDVEEFKSLNPTAENIAILIYNILRKEIDLKFDIKITLYETERNFVEYPS